MKAKEIGNMNFQPKCYNWSNLNLGKDARNHNIINNKGILKNELKKKIEKRVLKVNILVYSAKKKNAKLTAPCSVINPATYSLSASGKSKGARLDSATAHIINKIKHGNNIKKLILLESWFIKKSLILAEPFIKINKYNKIV